MKSWKPAPIRQHQCLTLMILFKKHQLLSFNTCGISDVRLWCWAMNRTRALHSYSHQTQKTLLNHCHAGKENILPQTGVIQRECPFHILAHSLCSLKWYFTTSHFIFNKKIFCRTQKNIFWKTLVTKPHWTSPENERQSNLIVPWWLAAV